MSGVNKVILVGNLGKDPEVRTLESGAKVASFSLATSETYKNKSGEKVEHTEWHNIVMWRGLADIVEKYVKKGDMIYVEGRLRTRSYEQEGVKKFFTEIQGDNMTMMGGGRKDNAPSESKVSEPEPAQPTPEDDLPF
jgi:single-strand DNA-binding protein